MSPGVQPNVLMLNLVKEHAALASCFQHGQDDQQICKLLKPQRCCSPCNRLSQDKLDSTGLLLVPSPHLRAGLLQLLVSLVPTWVATIGQPSLPSCGDIPAPCPQPCIFSLFLFDACSEHLEDELKKERYRKRKDIEVQTFRRRICEI